MPDSLRLIPFDFEKGDLGSKLTAHGFDLGKKTCFNWLGVTCYLTPNAIQDTLNDVTGIACPGSEIVFDYLADECSIPKRQRSLSIRLKEYVGKLGEPMITSFDPDFINLGLL